jgi:hypothetical protein
LDCERDIVDGDEVAEFFDEILDSNNTHGAAIVREKLRYFKRVW